MKSQLNPREGEEREQRPKWTHRKKINIHGKRTKQKVTSLRSKALTNLWAERSRKRKTRIPDIMYKTGADYSDPVILRE